MGVGEKQDGDTRMVWSGPIMWPALCSAPHSTAPIQGRLLVSLNRGEAEPWKGTWLVRF